MLARGLMQAGVDVVGPVGPGGRTGVVVSLSGFDNERSMLTDRGVAPLLDERELDRAWFGTGCWLHLPLYSLVDAPIRAAALRARRWSTGASLDLSSLTVINALGPQQVSRLVAEVAPDIVFANEAESALVPLEGVPTVVVKLGSRGVLVNGEIYGAETVAALDTTGAGDAFAAGFLLGGAELGLAAAARAVAQRGAQPPARLSAVRGAI
jgi:sugar/nucleoside kinase (ribokinase family)